jgi:hypothetical protein
MPELYDLYTPRSVGHPTSSSSISSISHTSQDIEGPNKSTDEIFHDDGENNDENVPPHTAIRTQLTSRILGFFCSPSRLHPAISFDSIFNDSQVAIISS